VYPCATKEEERTARAWIETQQGTLEVFIRPLNEERLRLNSGRLRTEKPMGFIRRRRF
jgi:hypothetical protein